MHIFAKGIDNFPDQRKAIAKSNSLTFQPLTNINIKYYLFS